jgi:hypothetical protein
LRGIIKPEEKESFRMDEKKTLYFILIKSILHTFTENGECYEHPAFYSVGAGL